MAGKLGKYQIVPIQGWKGMTKLNHLGAAFMLQPQKATNLMVNILAWNRGKTLDTFLSKFPVKEFEDSSEYTWDVLGSARRNIPLIEARDENGNIIEETEGRMIGAGVAPFYLVFPEDWFSDGRLIA